MTEFETKALHLLGQIEKRLAHIETDANYFREKQQRADQNFRDMANTVRAAQSSSVG